MTDEIRIYWFPKIRSHNQKVFYSHNLKDKTTHIRKNELA